MKTSPIRRNGEQRSGQNQQDESASSKINPFTLYRKQLCHQFVEMNTLDPGSELWVDQLLNFLMSRGQFGVTRESIKIWYKRQPAFFRPGIVGLRTGSGAAIGSGGQVRNSSGNFNFNTTPQSQIVQQQQSTTPPFQMSPFPFMPMEMPMPISIASSSSSSGQVQTPTEQKREDFNNSFELIRQLHTIFTRQDNLATCLIHLEKIQTICSRANNKFVLPSTYRENAQERLGSLSRIMKQEMQNPASVDQHEYEHEYEYNIGEVSVEEEEDDSEMVI